jgi:hypothetical protein
MICGVRSRVLLSALALGGALVAGGGTPIAALGAGSARPRCLTSQLRLSFVDAQAGLGHRYADYALKNLATTPCRLYGYPGVILLDAHGRALTSSHATVTRWTVSPRRTVVISPGQRAFFTFTWLDGGFCPGHSFSYSGMRVYPPGATRAIQRSESATAACDGSAMVSAVRPKLYSL